MISIKTIEKDDDRGRQFRNCHMFSRPQKTACIRM